MLMLEEKNKRLMEDNVEYVKEMIKMKENMASTINDLLSGKMSRDQVQTEVN